MARLRDVIQSQRLLAGEVMELSERPMANSRPLRCQQDHLDSEDSDGMTVLFDAAE